MQALLRDLARIGTATARMTGVLGLTILASCQLVPRELAYDDPQVQELLEAMDAASAHRFGFTPVPRDAEIRLEGASGTYDRMLHVRGRTIRTVAFRMEAGGFSWLGEQEIYRGPKQYATVDGTEFEQIVLTYERQPISQHRLDHLEILYSGEDPRLVGKDALTLQAILPVLREWGYDSEAIGSGGTISDR